MSVSTTVSQSGSRVISASSARRVQGLALVVLGAIMLVAVGFAPMAAAHNAAHDTRHVVAFPCH